MAGTTKAHTEAVKAFVELGVKPWAKTTGGKTTLEVSLSSNISRK